LPTYVYHNESSQNITLMQKAAIRIISDVSYNAHNEPLFKANKILPFTGLITNF
jgi:hypothetical protein